MTEFQWKEVSSCIFLWTHSQNNKLYIEQDTKWKTRILRQNYTADPVGMGRKLSKYNFITYRKRFRIDGNYYEEEREYSAGIFPLLAYKLGKKKCRKYGKIFVKKIREDCFLPHLYLGHRHVKSYIFLTTHSKWRSSLLPAGKSTRTRTSPPPSPTGRVRL